MAFPTTQMSGYAELKGRIEQALNRCQEHPWLDFKESQPWKILRWRLLKTIMGMANLRDGGLILIGIAEDGTSWRLTGIDSDHLLSFDYDDIVDQLSKYASPKVCIDIVVHKHIDGNEYLAFNVHQFSESPVICRANSSDDVRSKDRLVAGDVYMRPNTGKPQTVKITDASPLHDLLELAAEFRARRMLETGKRIGFISKNAAESHYDEELSTITEMPLPTRDHPHWAIWYRPESYTPDRIPSLSECVRAVDKARVRLRGWSFPHLADRDRGHTNGSNSVGSTVSFMDAVEYWRLFQSGQFVNYAILREALEARWKEKLRKDTISHLRHLRDIDWESIPGFISLVNLIYTVTEYFEFAARLSQAGILRGGLDIHLELNNVKGYVLTTDWERAWSEYRSASEPKLGKTWRMSSEQLLSNSKGYSLKAIIWLCECFGWMDPNVDGIKRDQEKLMSGNL